MHNRRPLFVIDSDVFIGAHRRHYALDLCPGFWDCLIHFCGENRVRSIDRVRDELFLNSDRLSEWAKQAPDDLFVSTADEFVIDTYMEMNKWVAENWQFLPRAKAEFANAADGWVAAYASVNKAIVITHEVFAEDVKRRVPIPNVCKKFHIDYQDTLEMLCEL